MVTGCAAYLKASWDHALSQLSFADALANLSWDTVRTKAPLTSKPHARPMWTNMRNLRSDRLGRFVRYGAVSAVSTATSLSVLGLLVGLNGLPATEANVIAVAVGTVPSFALNRRWVWSYRGPRALLKQALPYCVLALAGLVLSTVAVHVAASWTATSTRFVHTAAVEGANFGSYGLLWVLQFLLCDRVLFRGADHELEAAEPPRVESAA